MAIAYLSDNLRPKKAVIPLRGIHSLQGYAGIGTSWRLVSIKVTLT